MTDQELEKAVEKALEMKRFAWRDKAERLIGTLSQQAYHDANAPKHGRLWRKRHVPYSVPQLAKDLVECLNTNDEHRAKALFLSYDGMKAIGGKRRSAAPSRAQFKSLLSKAKRYIASHKGGKRRHSDPDVVDVLFRVVKAGDFKGTVEAWFPGLPGTNAYYRDMLTYAHMGQHGSGDIDYMQKKTRNAKPSEYASLKRELESVPFEYKLRVVKKMQRKHFEQRKAACQ